MNDFNHKLLTASQLLLEGKPKVLLAVSGGADSVAMAHGLVELKRQDKLSCEFVIAHVNHCLRGADSDGDQAFVQTIGDVLKVPVVTKSVNVADYAKKYKLSIETAGRRLRLNALVSIAADHDCAAIATAHHADDQAETLIHRLMRGTGFRGLCGIRPYSVVEGSVYVRPMLNLRRVEIIQYCKDNAIQWRQDASNADLQFTRNRIRHRLLSNLGLESDIVDSLVKLSVATQHLQKRVDAALSLSMKEFGVDDEGARQIGLDCEALQKCSPLSFYEIIRLSILTVGAGLRDYSRSHFDMIRRMIDQPKAKGDFPDCVKIIVKDKTVFIQQKGYNRSEIGIDEDAVVSWGDETVQFGSWQITFRSLDADQVNIEQFLKEKDSYVEWLDADTIIGPLIIRPRQDGDRFEPIGTNSSKKVARFLIDAQLDAAIKKNAFVITDAEKILWLVPVRMSEKVKISKETTRVLEIRVDRVKDSSVSHKH